MGNCKSQIVHLFLSKGNRGWLSTLVGWHMLNIVAGAQRRTTHHSRLTVFIFRYELFSLTFYIYVCSHIYGISLYALYTFLLNLAHMPGNSDLNIPKMNGVGWDIGVGWQAVKVVFSRKTVRNLRRKTTRVSQPHNFVMRAIQEVNTEEISIRATAEKCNIPFWSHACM